MARLENFYVGMELQRDSIWPDTSMTELGRLKMHLRDDLIQVQRGIKFPARDSSLAFFPNRYFVRLA